MSAIFLLPVSLTCWPRKNSTRADLHVDNSHQAWSWYDHRLPSYSVFVCWYVTWHCDHEFSPVDLEQLNRLQMTYTVSSGALNSTQTKPKLNSWCTWRVTWPTLPPSLKTLYLSVLDSWLIMFHVDYHWLRTRPLRMRRITWPARRRQKQLHFWNPRPRFAYSLCNFVGSTMKVIKFICENNSRPCVKRRTCMSFCACAKSRDLLNVP